MNKNIYDIVLCGNTGGLNRGCEAIIRSTNLILNEAGIRNVGTFSSDLFTDKRLGLDSITHLIAFPQKSIPVRLIGKIRRVFNPSDSWSDEHLYNTAFQSIQPQLATFNVGGDTYCYAPPCLSYGLNKVTSKKNIPNIFWGCSVETSCLADPIMQKDISHYFAVVVRETLSFQMIKTFFPKPERLIQACDPAFQLEIMDVDLPVGFTPGNTVGINISEMVLASQESSKDIVFQNVTQLIDFILYKTNMAVCLIPHVYSIHPASGDYLQALRIKALYQDNDRVSLVNAELSCCELKYIISKCRFFIGARTHSMIAAYSTGVPAIALSYSIKSRGIALDIFGAEEGFAMPYKKITKADELKRNFQKTLLDHENDIKQRYATVLPAYKESIFSATNQLLRLIKNHGQKV